MTVQGQIDESLVTALNLATSLTSPSRNVTSRSSFTITLDPPSHSPSAADIISLTLTSRIHVHNARSLLERPGLPRGPEFLDLFGPLPSANERPWSTREFYDNVHVPESRGDLSLPLIEGLQCALYPFQKRAVQWLLGRESLSCRDGSDNPRAFLHGFQKTQDADGRPCYFSRLFGLATTDVEMLQEMRDSLRGGILAEEMVRLRQLVHTKSPRSTLINDCLQGLGKTVEVIALICANKFNLERASCFHENVTQSPATLIITPPAILQQWKDEMRILAPHLNVTTYDGMRIEASQNDEQALIRKCLSHDVVSTTLLSCLVSYHAVSSPLCYLMLTWRFT